MPTSGQVDKSEVQEASIEELRQLGPIEVAFKWAIDGLEDFSRAALLDEETLTASFLGGLRVAVPAAAKLFGSGVEEKTRRCSWAAFNKFGRATDERSEAANGADFALVLWESESHARLCIFQAKKAEARGSSKAFDIHHSPNRPSDRRPQLVMLAAIGVRFMEALSNANAHPAGSGSIAPSIPDRNALVEILTDLNSEERMEKIGELNWIQYLVYPEGAPVCIPLSEIPAGAIEKEFTRGAKLSNYVDVGFGPTTLGILVSSGLSENEPETGWLRVDRHTLKVLLPELLELMPVHVASGRGGGLVNKPHVGVDVVAKPSSPAEIAALQEELASAPAPSTGSRMKF